MWFQHLESVRLFLRPLLWLFDFFTNVFPLKFITLLRWSNGHVLAFLQFDNLLQHVCPLATPAVLGVLAAYLTGKNRATTITIRWCHIRKCTQWCHKTFTRSHNRPIANSKHNHSKAIMNCSNNSKTKLIRSWDKKTFWGKSPKNM